MYFSLRMVPVPQWTHREFEGIDPWSGNRPVRWSIVVYMLVSETFEGKIPPQSQNVPGNSNDVPSHLAVGISADGRYRILPLALQDLWRAGQVRDQDLPQLLHYLEGGLKVRDYPPDRGSFVAVALGVFCALVFAGAFIYSLFSPPMDNVIAFMRSAEWLAQPIPGPQPVSMHEEIKPVRVKEIAPALVPTPGMETDKYHRRERTLLAVIQANQEKRLALISAPADLENPAGVVVRAATLNLPPPLIASLQQQFPDLNASYVLCVGWEKTDALSPYDNESFTLARQFAFVFGPLTLLCLLPALLRRQRRKAVAGTCLRLLDRHAAQVSA